MPSEITGTVSIVKPDAAQMHVDEGAEVGHHADQDKQHSGYNGAEGQGAEDEDRNQDERDVSRSSSKSTSLAAAYSPAIPPR